MTINILIYPYLLFEAIMSLNETFIHLNINIFCVFDFTISVINYNLYHKNDPYS